MCCCSNPEQEVQPVHVQPLVHILHVIIWEVARRLLLVLFTYFPEKCRVTSGTVLPPNQSGSKLGIKQEKQT